MNELLDNGPLGQQLLWGVEVWRLIVALALIFFGFLGRRIVKLLFGGMFRRKARETAAAWDDDAVELLAAPLGLCFQVFVWFVAASVLVLPMEPVDIRAFVYQGLKVAIAVALTWAVFRLIDVVAGVVARVSTRTESPLDDQIVPMLRKTLKVFLAIIVGVMIIQNFGYSVTSLIASLGIGGLALALAAKDTVANFFGSLVVFSDQPFHVGDWIEFGDVEGTVEEVGFRTTRVRRFDKSLATIPNQTFTSTTIVNHSRRPMRRIKMTVGLSYETTSEQMRKFIESVQGVIEKHPIVDPEFRVVRFTEFGDSSLNVLIYCFAQTTAWAEFSAAQEEIMLKIMDIVAEQGLEIAFPTRTVYLRDEDWQARLAAGGDGQVEEAVQRGRPD